VKAVIARLTSCTLEEPHYEIDSRSLDLRPGKRVILRHAKFKISGHTLFSVPYLSIPLDEGFYRYMPEIGNTPDEGWYIKTRFGVPLPGQNNLDVRFDAFSKIGIGLGGDLTYMNPRMNGTASAYVLTGSRESLQLSANHQMKVGRNDFSLDGSYQQDNYLSAPGSTISNIRTSFRIPQKDSTETRITYLRNSSSSFGFDSVGQTLGFTDRRVWNSRLNTNLDLSGTRDVADSSSERSTRQEANLIFQADQDLGKAQAILDYQRAIPIGHSTGFSGGLDRTPVFTMTSDTRRALGPNYKGAFMRSSVSWGEFADGFLSKRTSRAYFDLELDRPDTRDQRLSFDWGGKFRQGVYSDNTAQYVVDLNARAAYRLGKDTSFNVRYGTLRPYGYTPLSIDQASLYDQASFDLSFRPLRTLLVGAETAYDFLEASRSEVPWQNVGVRTEYQPTSYFRFRTSSLYDTMDQNWSSVRLDLAYKPGATYVGVGARYDGPRHTWGNANLYVDALKTGRLRSSVLLQYNGFLKQFESRHFSFTYDLTDCWEVIFQVIDNPLGFRAGTQYGLYIRLKAFPFATPFGIGQQGQPLGIGTGRDF
jgi:LPS-assembly protein